MKRIFLICFGLLAAVCFCALPVHAEAVQAEIYEDSGADRLREALPEEARFLLDEAGVSPEPGGQGDALGFLSALADGVRESFTEPLRALVLLLAVVVLCRIVAELASDGLTHTVGLCAALGAAGVLLPPLAGLIGKASAVTEAIGVFLLAAVPVYAGLLVTAGNAVTGATYGALTLAAANGVSALAVNVFVPLLRVFLALSAVSSVTSFDLKKLTDALYKLLKWALVLAVTVFTGILSVQTLVSAQSDAVTGKAARMIASSAIPIVGGAFGDAFSVLGASIGMIKSGVGAFGILASLAIFLPLCLQAAVWLGVCFLSSLAAELFSLSKLAAFLDGCATALKLLLAVVFSIGAVSVVSAAVVLCVRGAYA